MSPKITCPKADTYYLLLCTSSKVAVALDTSRAVAASALVEEEEEEAMRGRSHFTSFHQPNVDTIGCL